MPTSSSRPRADGLTEIAGLWERTSANGGDYIGGNSPEDQEIVIPPNSFIMVFPNDSDNPRAPTFRVLFAPPRGHAPAPPRTQTPGNFLRRNKPENPAASDNVPAEHDLHNPDEPGPPPDL